MSRRGQIRMSDAEVAAFLAEERTLTCATIGPRGWPHLMPLWYVPRDVPTGEAGPGACGRGRTRVSQKVRNLERDPRATLQVEAGAQYHELRGVMIECDVIVHRDAPLVKSPRPRDLRPLRLPPRSAARDGAAGGGRRDGRQAGASSASRWSSSSVAGRAGITASWAGY